MRLVILESPFAGNIEKNIEYARSCIRDCLMRDESPIASHLLYTQEGILNDNVAAEREHGIEAGLAWYRVAEASVVYVDHGLSNGMKYGVRKALEHGVAVEFRSLKSMLKITGKLHDKLLKDCQLKHYAR
jgi:hypothetical protein